MQNKSELKNYILKTAGMDIAQWQVESTVAKRLKMYVPRGCPFKNYTLLDLLRDLIRMYSWILDMNRKYSISDFIKKIQDRDIHAKVYGNAIIKLLEM